MNAKSPEGGRPRILKSPVNFRPARRSGTLLMDPLLPTFLIVLGLLTVGLLVFAVGIVLEIIPYE